MKRPCKISNRDWNGCGGIFDVEPRREKLTDFEEQMGQGGFWNDRGRAETVSREARALRSVIEPFDALQRRLTDLSELSSQVRFPFWAALVSVIGLESPPDREPSLCLALNSRK